MSLSSFSFCALALVFQLFEVRRRAADSDWTALMDTIPAVTAAAVMLLAVTLVLNWAALYRARRSE